MPIELTMVVLSGVLSLTLAVPYSTALILRYGMAEGFGNRAEPRELPAWGGRSRRAHWNMIENLPVFVALVFVAHAAGKLGPMTALGAQLFLYARVAHALLYIAGVPVLRTLAYLVGLVGLALIAIATFQ